jgi:hypothetical protein
LFRSGNRAVQWILHAGTLCRSRASLGKPGEARRIGAEAPCDRGRIVGSGNRVVAVGAERTGPRAVESTLLLRETAAAKEASWRRRSWGAVDFDVSGNRSDEIGFTTRTGLRSEIACIARATARSRGFMASGDHVWGPLLVGRPMEERASWNRETEDTEGASSRRRLRGECVGSGPARARTTERRDVHTTYSMAGKPVVGSVTRQTRRTSQAFRRERRGTNAAPGQPGAASVDATALPCGALQDRRRRENKLIAWATRR